MSEATARELLELDRYIEDLERKLLAEERKVKPPTTWWVVARAIAGCVVHPKAKA